MTANITIYTKVECPQSKKTKRLLAALDLEFTEIHLEENPEVVAFLKEEGYLAAPVVMTDEDSWTGFDEKKLRELAPSREEWDF